jgi:hypothetical protein
MEMSGYDGALQIEGSGTGNQSRILADSIRFDDDRGGHGTGAVFRKRPEQAEIRKCENVSDPPIMRRGQGMQNAGGSGQGTGTPEERGGLALYDWWQSEPDVVECSWDSP